MKFNYNDGGRAKAGYQGTTGDCVTRAIAIATGKDYQEVYNDLFKFGKEFAETHRSRVAKKIQSNGASPRNGVFDDVASPYLKSLGWKWIPTMFIGQGCKVHLKADELPSGTIICTVSRHWVAVVDGVINDIFDCSRNETRCVYGYFVK